MKGKCTEISISKVSPRLCVDLRVSVEISDSLDVHHDQLVARSLKREVTEGLMDTKWINGEDD